MQREILISQVGQDLLIAVIEDQKLVEFRSEAIVEQKLLGNIYKGRVKRLLVGMDAAFVDIGEDLDGFLYISDLRSRWRQWLKGARGWGSGSGRQITDYIRENEELIVQVKREASDHKAPRVSTKVSITGTYLVYTPTGSHVGVSSRIGDPARRARLKQLGSTWVGAEGGLIFRTASVNVSDEVLYHEWCELRDRWQRIIEIVRRRPAPRLVYRERSLIPRFIRDLLGPSLVKIEVENDRL